MQRSVRFLFKSISCRTFRTFSTNVDVIYKEDHVEMRKNLRKLIDAEINPHVDSWEENGPFPAHKIMKLLGQAGFIGVNKPVEYGGSGLDLSYAIAITEELGRINCGGVPMAISVHSDMATPALMNFGSDELKREFLTPTISGDVVACVGVSEAGGGSDVASIKTDAKQVGDDLVINGSKMWITNGCQADWMCLLANTSTENGPHKNKSLICVPMKTKGITISRNIKKLGMHSSDTAEVFFDNVGVPAKNVIGDQGRGFMYLMLQFQTERLCAVALSLLPMESCIQLTADYARERQLFSRKLIDFQSVQFKLAELQSEVECLRSILYRAVYKNILGEDVTMLASMSKLKAGRLSRLVSDSCLQIWGGMGYCEEALISRAFRDSRLLSIAGGSDEVMLSIIGKYMRLN